MVGCFFGGSNRERGSRTPTYGSDLEHPISREIERQRIRDLLDEVAALSWEGERDMEPGGTGLCGHGPSRVLDDNQNSRAMAVREWRKSLSPRRPSRPPVGLITAALRGHHLGEAQAYLRVPRSVQAERGRSVLDIVNGSCVHGGSTMLRPSGR